jgi:hypothetical protein
LSNTLKPECLARFRVKEATVDHPFEPLVGTALARYFEILVFALSILSRKSFSRRSSPGRLLRRRGAILASSSEPLPH